VPGEKCLIDAKRGLNRKAGRREAKMDWINDVDALKSIHPFLPAFPPSCEFSFFAEH
jgi:hypothetical protein